MRVILLTLLLAGCAMSNDEIIAATEKCREANMDIQVFRFDGVETIMRIECVPRNK